MKIKGFTTKHNQLLNIKKIAVKRGTTLTAFLFLMLGILFSSNIAFSSVIYTQTVNTNSTGNQTDTSPGQLRIKTGAFATTTVKYIEYDFSSVSTSTEWQVVMSACTDNTFNNGTCGGNSSNVNGHTGTDIYQISNPIYRTNNLRDTITFEFPTTINYYPNVSYRFVITNSPGTSFEFWGANTLVDSSINSVIAFGSPGTLQTFYYALADSGGIVPPSPSASSSEIYTLLPSNASVTASTTFPFTVCARRGTDLSSPIDGQFYYPEIQVSFNPLESVYAGPSLNYYVDITENDACYYGTSTLPTGQVQMSASFYNGSNFTLPSNAGTGATSTQFTVVESYVGNQQVYFESVVSSSTSPCTTATSTIDRLICGIGSAVTSPLRTLFSPSNSSLNQFSNIASSTSNLFPFVYMYQSAEVVSILFSTTSSSTSGAIAIPAIAPFSTSSITIFGPVTVTNVNNFAGFNLWGLIYSVMIISLYLGALWSCVTIVRYA